jgi:hypothetical protein
MLRHVLYYSPDDLAPKNRVRFPPDARLRWIFDPIVCPQLLTINSMHSTYDILAAVVGLETQPTRHGTIIICITALTTLTTLSWAPPSIKRRHERITGRKVEPEPPSINGLGSYVPVKFPL